MHSQQYLLLDRMRGNMLATDPKIEDHEIFRDLGGERGHATRTAEVFPNELRVSTTLHVTPRLLTLLSS